MQGNSLMNFVESIMRWVTLNNLGHILATVYENVFNCGKPKPYGMVIRREGLYKCFHLKVVIFMDEIFVDMKGFEGYYKISNTGKVFSVRNNRLLNVKPKYTGYVDIELNVNKVVYYKRVHRLVAENFIPNPNNKPFVNHKDGNKQNNNVENLEWVTASENQLHAIRTGLQPKSRIGCKHRLYLGNDVMILNTNKDIMKITGLAKDRLKFIKRNKLPIPYGKYKGYFVETII